MNIHKRAINTSSSHAIYRWDQRRRRLSAVSIQKSCAAVSFHKANGMESKKIKGGSKTRRRPRRKALRANGASTRRPPTRVYHQTNAIVKPMAAMVQA